MKSLIKTYVDPRLEDRIKILAQKHNVSVSGLVSELLNQTLNQTESHSIDETARFVEEQMYLQYFILTTLLGMDINLDEKQYNELKQQSRSWAQKRIQEITQNAQ
ncbi:MAG: hypothetical protein U9N57_09500 [Pseudomonadota bacterium]|nr:hypothetical protein [Pseudomonadota bacterium]